MKTDVNQFQEIGNYLIQTGLYLCTKEKDKFELDNQVHINIINFLMQSYLYLKTYNDNPISAAEVNKVDLSGDNEDRYMSRKEILQIYHPLFTEYGLSQAIHTKGLPHIKRGSKYFFKKSEIDDWLDKNKGKRGSNTMKWV